MWQQQKESFCWEKLTLSLDASKFTRSYLEISQVTHHHLYLALRGDGREAGILVSLLRLSSLLASFSFHPSYIIGISLTSYPESSLRHSLMKSLSSSPPSLAIEKNIY